jgi:hypothetical protein
VKIEHYLPDVPYLPEQITRQDFLYLNIPGFGPKNCNPVVDGTELKDWVIETILNFENQTDINGDGKNDLVADVVMYYWVCN